MNIVERVFDVSFPELPEELYHGATCVLYVRLACGEIDPWVQIVLPDILIESLFYEAKNITWRDDEMEYGPMTEEALLQAAHNLGLPVIEAP